MIKLPERFVHHRRLQSLVESQTTYTLERAEMHVFETHTEASRVLLKFDQPVLASMLEGKKVMHLRDLEAFDFLPGESLVLPGGETMCIDFPEAKMDEPTRCLAMAISEEKILETIDKLNETMPSECDVPWDFGTGNFHLTNDRAIHQIIERLLFLFIENHPSKDLFADFMLRELLIRLLQTKKRRIYTEDTPSLSSSNRLACAMQHIRNNLDRQISIQELSRVACMSESNFHRVFKNEMGVSPVDFIINERIRLACSMLQDSSCKIKEVYHACGFNSMSYFSRVFKRRFQLSPKEYQMKHARNNAFHS